MSSDTGAKSRWPVPAAVAEGSDQRSKHRAADEPCSTSRSRSPQDHRKDTRSRRRSQSPQDRRKDTSSRSRSQSPQDRRKDTRSRRRSQSPQDRRKYTSSRSRSQSPQDRRKDTRSRRRSQSPQDRRKYTSSRSRSQSPQDRRKDTHSRSRSQSPQDRRKDTRSKRRSQSPQDRRKDTRSRRRSQSPQDRRKDTRSRRRSQSPQNRRKDTRDSRHLKRRERGERDGGGSRKQSRSRSKDREQDRDRLRKRCPFHSPRPEKDGQGIDEIKREWKIKNVTPRFRIDMAHIEHIDVAQTLDLACRKLCFDPDNELRRLILTHGVLTMDQHDAVYNQQVNQTPSARVSAIIRYIKWNGSDSYIGFRECLIELKREDLVQEMLPPYFNEAAGRVKIYLEPFLVKRIECTYGLIPRLLTNRVLAMSEGEEISKILSDQNSHLLYTIAHKPEGRHQEDFLKSLEETCQNHLANYIRLQKAIAEGEDTIDFGDELPLSDFEVDKLAQRSDYLIHQLDLSKLWHTLLEKKCFNEWHKEELDYYLAIGKKLKMNQEFLFLLTHRSLIQYKHFRASLHFTGHSEVEDPLDVDGAITALGALLETAEGKPVNVDVEKTIEEQCRLTNKADCIAAVCNAAHVSSVWTGSMRVYFLCLTLKSLRKLRELYDSDQLKPLVESYYNQLLAGTEYPAIRIKMLYCIDYCKCEEYFLHVNRDRDGAEASSDKRETLNLPPKIWEEIVLKSCSFERSTASDQIVHCKLSSVCSSWRRFMDGAPQFESYKRFGTKFPIWTSSGLGSDMLMKHERQGRSLLIDSGSERIGSHDRNFDLIGSAAVSPVLSTALSSSLSWRKLERSLAQSLSDYFFNREITESEKEDTRLTGLPSKVWIQIVLKSFRFVNNCEIASSSHKMKYVKLSSVCTSWRHVVASNCLPHFTTFMAHEQFLIKNIELEFGLLESLLDTRVLTDLEYHKIKNGLEGDRMVLNRKFIKILQRKQATMWGKIKVSLTRCGMDHIMAYLTYNRDGDDDIDDLSIKNDELVALEISVNHVCEIMDFDEIVNGLQAVHCINEGHRQYLNNLWRSEIYSDRLHKELLAILKRRSSLQLKRFNGWRVTYAHIPLDRKEDSGLRDTVRRLRKHIATKMESGYAFLNPMHCFGLLTKEQADEVSNIQAGEKRNNAILDIICKKEDEESYNRFVTILEETQQKDMANFIRACGAAQGSVEMPLAVEQGIQLQVVTIDQLQQFDIPKLSRKLRNMGFITENDLESIKRRSSEMIKKLLEIVNSMPSHEYMTFLNLVKDQMESCDAATDFERVEIDLAAEAAAEQETTFDHGLT